MGCSEWAVGNEWLGVNSGAMLLATAYVLLAGSYLEWCMILRARYEVPFSCLLLTSVMPDLHCVIAMLTSV